MFEDLESLLPGDDLGPAYGKTKRLPRPKLDDLITEANELIIRDMRRDQLIYKGRRVARASIEYEHGAANADGNDLRDKLVRLSIPSALTKETARLVGRQRPLVRVVAENDTEEAEKAAQLPEAYLRNFEQKLDDRFQASGGQATIGIARAMYAAQDGRVCEILTLNPEDPTFPYTHRLVDPVAVHCVWGDDGIDRAYHTTGMTTADIRRWWPDATAVKGERIDQPHTIIAYYDADWMAVIIDGKDWLKKPFAHGYPNHPVIYSHFNGEPGAIVDSSNTADPSWEEAVRGTGIFWAHIDEYTEYVRTVSALIYDTVMNASPPIKKMLPPGNNNFDAEVAPDEPIDIPNGGDVEFLYRQGGLPHAKTTQELLSNLIQAGTLPMGQADFSSGFERMVASQKGQSFFIPFVEGFRGHYRRIYRAALDLYKSRGIPTTMVEMGTSGRPIKRQFTPKMVPEDVVLDVEFGELQPADQWQAMAAATPMLASGFLDEYTLYHDLLRLPNAQQIVDRIRESRNRMNPVVAQATAELDALSALEERYETAMGRGDHDLAELVMMRAKLLYQQMSGAMASPAQPPGAQNGATGQVPAQQPQPGPQALPIQGLSGGTGAQGPDAGPPGLPPNVAPDQAASGGLNQLDPALIAALMARMTRGPAQP